MVRCRICNHIPHVKKVTCWPVYGCDRKYTVTFQVYCPMCGNSTDTVDLDGYEGEALIDHLLETWNMLDKEGD